MINENLDKAIRIFAEFLNNTWNTVMPLLIERYYTTDESSVSDWLQANWEILVERKIIKLNFYLEVYGEGADFNGTSSRITDQNALPNFSVKINQSSQDKIFDFLNEKFVYISNSDFIHLVSFKDGFYHKEPIFNFVLLEDEKGIERVVQINDIKFDLFEIKKRKRVKG